MPVYTLATLCLRCLYYVGFTPGDVVPMEVFGMVRHDLLHHLLTCWCSGNHGCRWRFDMEAASYTCITITGAGWPRGRRVSNV